MIDEHIEVGIANNGTASATFQMRDWARWVGVYVPAIVDGALGLEVSVDAGSNYAPILDPADGDDALLVKSGSDPGYIDFSDWVRSVSPDHLLRFTCAAQNAGAVTLTVCFKGV